jgi:dTDP-4-amino-4,6-dideoxygalactose transaminase
VATATAAQRLAVLGGPPAVTAGPAERWRPPVERELELVSGLLRARFLSGAGSGFVREVEEEFRATLGVKHCASQNNGTSTLWAAYFAAGVGPGDEVLHPAFTWICSIAPAVHLGARPVFCEIDPRTLVIDPADVARRITPRTRAISVVHLFGNPCDMDAIMAVARRHRLAVIEDCSHAHGATYKGRPVGTLGDVGCFSLQGGNPGGKAVAGGEGGFVATDDDRLWERVMAFGHLNRAGLQDEYVSPEYRRLGPTGLGLKFRAHPLALALAKASLETLAERNERLRANAAVLRDALARLPGLTPVATYPGAQMGGFYGGLKGLYDPAALGGLPLDRFVAAMRAEGAPMHGRAYDLTHLLPVFAEGFDLYGGGRGPLAGDYRGYRPGDLPVTEAVHPRIVSFPALIDPAPGYLDQYVGALEKVTAQAPALVAAAR